MLQWPVAASCLCKAVIIGLYCDWRVESSILEAGTTVARCSFSKTASPRHLPALTPPAHSLQNSFKS